MLIVEIFQILPVVKFCGTYLVDNLTAENCLGVRAILIASYHCHQDPINRLDAFIKQNVCPSVKCIHACVMT